MARHRPITAQQQALSVYFRDMLAEPFKPAGTQPSATVPVPPPPGELTLLQCDIAGMALLLPVTALDNIVRWPSRPLTRLPASPDWLLGIYSERGHHTRVLDIRHLLEPSGKIPHAPPRYILLVDAQRHGIACDQIHHIVTVASSAVSRRRDLSHRPWFSGVVAEEMRSLLDIEALLDTLGVRELA